MSMNGKKNKIEMEATKKRESKEKKKRKEKKKNRNIFNFLLNIVRIIGQSSQKEENKWSNYDMLALILKAVRQIRKEK